MARIKLGPWGHFFGVPKQVFDHSGYEGIKSIAVTYSDNGIDRLRFHYMQRGIADPVVLEVGGTGGSRLEQFELHYPREYLVKIEGYYEFDENCSPIIKQLWFFSNRGDFGPYGGSGKYRIEITMKGAKIVGFHGDFDRFISHLGVYVEPYGAPCPTIVPRNPGPWGGAGGNLWDDGVNTRINKVVIYVDGAVLSLQTFYELDGSFQSTLHPGKTGGTSSTVEFKKENDEHLERISGFIGPMESDPKTVVVKALRFHSNKTTYGPYGDETGMGEFFSSSTDKGEIFGFYGRCGEERLYAIGVRIRYKIESREASSKYSTRCS